jgi:hypothetical protein
MICSAIQIDSFWKTFVLSNDCESSIRAIVIDPPRFGVLAPLLFGESPARLAAVPTATRAIALATNAKALM